MAGPRRARAFTLMETLVMLLISALAMSLMFQALAGFNRSRQRAAALEGVRDNGTVVLDWLRDSIRGLVALDMTGLTVKADDPVLGLKGDARGFTATTLDPLLGAAGVPVTVSWRVQPAAGGDRLVYREAGQPPLTLALRDAGALHFAYLDRDGKALPGWPPKLGLQKPLPQAIELLGDGSGGSQVMVQSIAVPRPMPLTPYTNPEAQ
ncbi:MAG: type II secretion system protein [Xanthomonadaceae bacterium]|jgi:type II secretory pathway pseudopilin PulG|nr:type II secretion system protein [Xanthomonadaceae bacterium]MDE3072546.1 type II secretion system protein [Pseudomonadota bacterium]